MQLLNVLLEDEGIQKYLNENEQEIVQKTEMFNNFPQDVKNYIQENLEEFIVKGDLKQTYQNMVSFTESAVVSFLEDLTA